MGDEIKGEGGEDGGEGEEGVEGNLSLSKIFLAT